MQAVSAGANGPSSHRKQQEKQKVIWFPKPNLHEIKIHSTIACHIRGVSFCVCCIPIFHMY